jgi:hypothetical protein
MMRGWIYGLLSAVLLLANRAHGQSPSVVGVAYDSLTQRPLVGAFVSLGNASTGFTDSAGIFRFENVVAGTQRISVEHVAIDSLGLPALTANVNVRAGMDTVRIAIPSFATMWSRVCGSAAPRDGALLFGTARDAASRRPLPQTQISATWVTRATGATTQDHWRVDAKTDASGAFALCGLPTTIPTRITALRDSGYLIAIDVTMPKRPQVIRRDLMMQSHGPEIARGTVTGVVTYQGRPLGDVRVLADWTDEATTNAAGAFKLIGVPLGTRALYVVPLGMGPTQVTVDVSGRDTARVTIALPDADSAEADAIRARAALIDGFDARRRSGVGYFIDSVQLSRAKNFFVALADVPDGLVQARSDGIRLDLPECQNTPMWIDGAPAPTDVLMKIRPSELLGMEIYKRYETPAELRAHGVNIPPRKCAIVMWMKRK